MLAVALAIVAPIHWYLWKRLVKDTTRTRRARRVGTALVVLLALSIPATQALSRVLPYSWQALVAWPGFLWLALMFYLLVTLAILEIPRLALVLWRRRSRSTAAGSEDSTENRNAGLASHEVADKSDVPGNSTVGRSAGNSAQASGKTAVATIEPAAPADERFDAGRRLLLGRSLAATAGVLSASTVGVGVFQAMAAPDLKRVPIQLPKLPASMNGFRIALVSDIHLGPLLGRGHTERIVRMINSVDADLVAIVGDLVDGSVAQLGAAAEPLQDLRARHGSFFVTGNHEYFSDYQEWVDEVNSLGVRVLRNERVDVQGLDLAGVNDLNGTAVGDGPDFGKALDGRDAARPVVLLAHQPVQAHEAARHGVDLQLSGHTHGGQMVPFNLLVGLQQPVVAGLGNVDGTQVYVTRGAGFWGPPVRFGAPPDISVIELNGA
ncbi:metallophosphoesterase [Dactylosporangium sp. NPDC051484]|uniref:metallophosphoesterase n=1 Tax=Dactylosporangium sp. NPDC051484 TaxID=3154942 RepID=UPI00345018F9